MFSGDESTRFESTAPRSKVYDQIEDALSTLGDAEVDKRGNIDIIPRSSLSNALTKITIEGSVRERDGEYTVTLDYTCALNGLGWVVLILGILFFLVGLLVLLGPMFAKGKVTQSARRALRAID